MNQRVDRVRFVNFTAVADRRRDQNDSDNHGVSGVSLRSGLYPGHSSPFSLGDSVQLSFTGPNLESMNLAQRSQGNVLSKIGGSLLGVLMHATEPFMPAHDAAVGGCGSVVLKPRSWDLGFATAPPSKVNARPFRALRVASFFQPSYPLPRGRFV